MKTARILFTIILFPAVLGFMQSCKKDKSEPVANLPVLTTANVSSILLNTALSGGSITNDGGLTITARGVVWSKHDLPTTADEKSVNGSGAGSYSSTVSGLEPGVTYYLRAYATNADGTAYGSTMIFTTISDTFTDSRDGNLYHAIQIGDQVWMTENLKYLPSVVGPGVESFTIPYYYVYDYTGTNVTNAKSTPNYKNYGVLYNWEAARTAAPDGWHLPSDQEWKTLEMALGMSQSEADGYGSRGTNQGSALAGNSLLWVTGNLTADSAFGSSGFNALPGGFYRAFELAFLDLSYSTYFWCSGWVDDQVGWRRTIIYNSAKIGRETVNKNIGFQVRCIRN